MTAGAGFNNLRRIFGVHGVGVVVDMLRQHQISRPIQHYIIAFFAIEFCLIVLTTASKDTCVVFHYHADRSSIGKRCFNRNNSIITKKNISSCVIVGGSIAADLRRSGQLKFAVYVDAAPSGGFPKVFIVNDFTTGQIIKSIQYCYTCTAIVIRLITVDTAAGHIENTGRTDDINTATAKSGVIPCNISVDQTECAIFHINASSITVSIVSGNRSIIHSKGTIGVSAVCHKNTAAKFSYITANDASGIHIQLAALYLYAAAAFITI